MPNEEAKDQRNIIPTVSCMLPSGETVEIVYDAEARRTSLAVGSGEDVSLVPSLDLEGGDRLIPWRAESNLIKRAVVLLPERPEDFGNLGELVVEIDA